jgi:RIO-like serine/threonine protein kinase
LGPDKEPDRYTFEKRIDNEIGTAGRVYLATDKNGNKVAIKTGFISMDEIKCLQRIKKCVEDMANKKKQFLCKKYLMAFYEVFQTQDSDFIVVENLESYEDLMEWTKKYKKKSVYQTKMDIIKLMDNIIQGYLALESIMVDHNDLINIMVDPKTLDIKIIDFGECYPRDFPKERYTLLNYDLEKIVGKIFQYLNKHMYKPEDSENLMFQNSIRMKR